MAHEDPEIEVFAFRSLDILKLSQPHLDAFGRAAGIDRVGGIGARAARQIDQRGSAGLGLGGIEHGVWLLRGWGAADLGMRRQKGNQPKNSASSLNSAVIAKGRPIAISHSQVRSRR